MAGDGTGLAAHAGSVAVRMLADRVDLTGHLSTALVQRGVSLRHHRSRALIDLSTIVTDGGEAIADGDTLRHHVQVLGPVASAPLVPVIDVHKTGLMAVRLIISRSPRQPRMTSRGLK